MSDDPSDDFHRWCRIISGEFKKEVEAKKPVSDLFLIAHKVRGEPAFDVAIMLDLLDEDGEPMWIIPTSGHRAYPYHVQPLKDLGCDVSWPGEPEFEPFFKAVPPIPPGLPDHYPHAAEPGKAAINIAGIIPVAKPQRRF